MALQDLRARAALDVLHDDVVAAVVDAGVVDLDDVGVDQLRDRQRLAPEAGDEALVVGEVLGEDLDRDRALEDAVGRLVDVRHPARAEPVADLVAARERPGRHQSPPPAAARARPRRRPPPVSSASGRPRRSAGRGRRRRLWPWSEALRRRSVLRRLLFVFSWSSSSRSSPCSSSALLGFARSASVVARDGCLRRWLRSRRSRRRLRCSLRGPVAQRLLQLPGRRPRALRPGSLTSARRLRRRRSRLRRPASGPCRGCDDLRRRCCPGSSSASLSPPQETSAERAATPRAKARMSAAQPRHVGESREPESTAPGSGKAISPAFRVMR